MLAYWWAQAALLHLPHACTYMAAKFWNRSACIVVPSLHRSVYSSRAHWLKRRLFGSASDRRLHWTSSGRHASAQPHRRHSATPAASACVLQPASLSPSRCVYSMDQAHWGRWPTNTCVWIHAQVHQQVAVRKSKRFYCVVDISLSYMARLLLCYIYRRVEREQNGFRISVISIYSESTHYLSDDFDRNWCKPTIYRAYKVFLFTVGLRLN